VTATETQQFTRLDLQTAAAFIAAQLVGAACAAVLSVGLFLQYRGRKDGG
jgi:hypothetical protein